MELRTVAALYVDPRGPYPKMSGVECWDETRDARLYAGPHPVVAHPPCGPWGKLKHFCKHQARDCALRAVDAVRRWGGVLEHPVGSSLWAYCALPAPGALPDRWGGVALEVQQCDWEHPTRKPTWLYVVRCSLSGLRFPPRREPTHSVCNGRGQKLIDGTERLRATAFQARATPPAFAQFLVELARNARVSSDAA